MSDFEMMMDDIIDEAEWGNPLAIFFAVLMLPLVLAYLIIRATR